MKLGEKNQKVWEVKLIESALSPRLTLALPLENRAECPLLCAWQTLPWLNAGAKFPLRGEVRSLSLALPAISLRGRQISVSLSFFLFSHSPPLSPFSHSLPRKTWHPSCNSIKLIVKNDNQDYHRPPRTFPEQEQNWTWSRKTFVIPALQGSGAVCPGAETVALLKIMTRRQTHMSRVCALVMTLLASTGMNAQITWSLLLWTSSCNT